MPSFERDVVLRGLIEKQLPARIGPDYLGPGACADFAAQLGVWNNQLWGAICSLIGEGRLEKVRVPDSPHEFALMPTYKGEQYFKTGSKKQPYPLQQQRRQNAISV